MDTIKVKNITEIKEEIEDIMRTHNLKKMTLILTDERTGKKNIFIVKK